MPSHIVAANPKRERPLGSWRRWEQVGLAPVLELDELVLNWANRRVNDLDVKGALVSINLERTIEGGSTVTIVIADPDGRLFSQRAKRMRSKADTRSRAARRAYYAEPTVVDEGWEPILPPDVIGGAVELELDGVVFRLVKVRYSTSSQQAELVFEDRIVYLLKRKRGAKRANRKRCTRAEFILSLLREVKGARYRFVCPELHERQAIDTSSARSVRHRGAHSPILRATTTSSSERRGDDERSGGFAPNAKLTVKRVAATAEQKRNLSGVLTECAARDCSTDVMVATVCCVIQESVAKRVRHGDAAGPDSRGLYQQRAPWGPERVRLDPRGSTAMFLTGGRGGQPGYKQRHGSLKRVPGGIDGAVTAVQTSVGGYAQHEREAKRIVNAWRGGDEGAASTGSYAKSYQYTRNADESSWEAMKRLADEVGWRLFVVGNTVYYMSELDLYARRSRYDIAPDDPAIIELAYDVDWGKPVSEMTATVALDQWGAPPGAVVNVAGYGPPDGRWLIVSTTRDYFAPTATVTLRQPGKEKLEPAAERVQRASNASGSSGSSSSGLDGSRAMQLYRECKRISDAGGPYVYGGGHGPRLSSLSSGQGLDCSSSSSLALYRARMFDDSVAIVSGAFARSWGKPGRGRDFTVWANDGHVWIEFHGVGNADRFDTSSYGSGGGGPRLRSTDRPTSGFIARHWPGS